MSRCRALLLILFWGFQAQAQLTIEITQGIDNPTPIAISPFSCQAPNKTYQDIAEIVNSDLSRTGMFNCYPKRHVEFS